MVLCSDYKYSKPIEHYAIFTAYFYLSFRFIHCFVAGRSTGNSMLRLKILFGFLVIPIADSVLSTDVGVCIAESEQQLLRCHAFLAG